MGSTDKLFFSPYLIADRLATEYYNSGVYLIRRVKKEDWNLIRALNQVT